MSLKEKIDQIEEFNKVSNPSYGLQLQLAIEEMNEAADALYWFADDFTDEDRVKEMCDVLYTILPLFRFLNVDPDAALNRVHESNMSKLWPGHDGKYMMVKDKSGKVTKGPNYKPAQLKDLLSLEGIKNEI